MDLKELTQQPIDENYSRHPWELARLEFVYKKINKHVNQNELFIFLDIGCGDTFIAEQLLKRMPNSAFYCIDNAFSEKQLVNYSNKYRDVNIKVYNELNSAIQDIKSEIGYILLLDVLEHVENDAEFLKQITQLKYFSSKSKILITVPAFQSLFTQHDYILGHYRRYTNKSLEKTTQKSELHTLNKGYFFSSLLLPRYILKIKEHLIKSKSQSTSISRWNKGLLITELYKNILILDFTITSFLEKFHIKPVGLSNFIICKKHAS